MDWLFPAVIATLVSSLVLATTYLYLYIHDRKKFLIVWGVSWLIYALRFFFMLCALKFSSGFYTHLCISANQLAALFSGFLLITGTYLFNKRKLSPIWKVVLALASLWIISGLFIKKSFLIMTLPIYLFLGIIYIWTGIALLRKNTDIGSGRAITGIAFILWGIHKMDYPILRPVTWFAPWGYMLGATLEIVVAIGMMIIYFNRSRQQIRESENRFRLLVEQTPLPLGFVDESGTVRMLNDRFVKIFGYTVNDIPTLEEWWPRAYPDQTYRDRVMSTWNEKVSLARANKSDIEENEYRVTCKDGAVRNVLIGGTILENSYIIILRDITDQKRMEAENRELESRLSQLQKMDAMGTLAGGIAHDFNNILGGIMGYTDMALCTEIQEEQHSYLQKSLAACERARNLITQILTFSRQRPDEMSTIQLCPVVKEAVKLLRASLPSSINIKTSYKSHDLAVLANPSKIHECVINLCTNAAQAMNMRGTMTIECLDQKISSKFEGRLGMFVSGRYSIIRISDTGSGIDQATLERIFEPFFTTKEPGKGTGLGLSVVFGIVKNHGGNLTVESTPGYGSVFTIFLPVSPEQIFPEAPDPAEIQSGNETILLLDDENILVDMFSDMLKSLGYTVLPFTKCGEALCRIEEDPDSIDIVITDLTMPKLNGIEFARKVTEIRKDVPILLCTGDNEIPFAMETATQAGIHQILKKPIRRSEIARAIRNVLKTRPPQLP